MSAPRHWRAPIVLPVLSSFVFIAAAIYAYNLHEAMLFQHGTPEVPSNKAFVILNPFRDRQSEGTADRLIRDLRSGECEDILTATRIEHSRQVCETVKESRSARLIWRKDDQLVQTLVYQLPENNSRLWIEFHLEESGFGVRSLSVVR